MTKRLYQSTLEAEGIILKVDGLEAGYGSTQILRGISLYINRGEMITLIGSNGVGKTTFLMTLSGIINPSSGTIEFMGKRIEKLAAHKIVELGMIQVPQGGLLFPEMTVLENLEIGSWKAKHEKNKNMKQKLDKIYSYFEVLRERQQQKVATLSGGEQQMLAIARALMASPKLLLMDEPSAGVSPIIVERLGKIIDDLHKDGLSILLVEQNVFLALDLADRGYILEMGKIAFEGNAEDVAYDDRIKRSYLGM